MDELLLAEEIDKRIYDTQTKINSIEYDVDILRRSPAIPDNICSAKINIAMNVVDNLRQDIQAYQTALEADPEDYD